MSDAAKRQAAKPEEQPAKLLGLWIDGVHVQVRDGCTLLEAAQAAGAKVPTLCFDQRLRPFGACRACLVGVSGSARPLPACTTLCNEGMRIDTQDPLARKVAAMVVELVLSELPSAPEPHTELARLAAEMGIEQVRFSGAKHAECHDEAHPYLAFRQELCISCGRCVRACDEIQGAFALTATGRGFQASITAGLDSGFAESACVSCGACADTCPTEAIAERSLLTLSTGSKL